MLLHKIFSNKGISATDIIIGFVVACILGIVIYNVNLKYKSSQIAKSKDIFIEKKAKAALKAISKDLKDSMMYAAGCSGAGLITPIHNSTEENDEIDILIGEKFSGETLERDMEKINSPMAVKLGTNFVLDQRLTICDDTSIDYFTVSMLSHKEEEGFSLLVPAKEIEEARDDEEKVEEEQQEETQESAKEEVLEQDIAVEDEEKEESDEKIKEGNKVYPISKPYLTGSIIGDFKSVHYFLKKINEKQNVLIREVEGEEKAIAKNIEKLTFEYYTPDSDQPVRDLEDLTEIIAVKVTVQIKTKDKNASDDADSVTDDDSKLYSLSAKIPFVPVDVFSVENIAYKIIKDRKSGEDFPRIRRRGKRTQCFC